MSSHSADPLSLLDASHLFVNPLDGIPSGPGVQLINLSHHCLLLCIRNSELVVCTRLRHYFDSNFQKLEVAHETVEFYDLFAVALEYLDVFIIDGHAHVFGH